VTSPAVSPLAYVFWHCARSGTDAAAYRADLLGFHSELSASPPLGFLGRQTASVAGASWFAGAGEVYEDWYVVLDWSAMGALNAAAIDDRHRGSHDRVAHLAGEGAGAIYALRAGAWAEGHRFGTWFAKPAGWSHADLDASLAASLGAGTSLWQRQMVLGPAPEFCLRSHEPPPLLAGIDGEQVAYAPLP
jgi:hypothetical protein